MIQTLPPGAVIAVDFDGTCVDHRYPNIGRDVPEAAATLRAMVKAGYKLVLFTMRPSGPDLDAAVKWFHGHGITLYGVQTTPPQKDWTDSPKPDVNLFIDDRAFGCPLVEYAAFKRPVVDWVAIREAYVPAPVKLLCSICRKPQFETPSGATCGEHGGAAGIPA